MKLIVALICFLSLTNAYAQCVDFTGKYQDSDSENPFGNIEITQSGCDTLTNTWYLPDGTSPSVTVITDGKLRRNCQNGRCSMVAYTQTADSFKAIEIHQNGDRVHYANSKAVKLNNGDMEVTNESFDEDGRETIRRTVWRFVP